MNCVYAFLDSLNNLACSLVTCCGPSLVKPVTLPFSEILICGLIDAASIANTLLLSLRSLSHNASLNSLMISGLPSNGCSPLSLYFSSNSF